MNQNAPDIVIITGATATGKTDAAVEFAARHGGEVISADSMLVYRGMDIGTAKPDAAQLARVPHHMIDVADPCEDFSVARWQAGAEAAIADIASRGRLPVVAGGTGLYILALQRPYSFAGGGEGTSPTRAALEEELRLSGPERMHARLAGIDPESAARLPVGDTRRVLRALEVFLDTGVTLTEKHRADALLPPRHRAALFVLDMEREALYSRIERRVGLMLEAGLEAEVRRLLDCGVPEGATAMQGLGYKELAAFIRGDVTRAEAVETLCRRTRNFAKRQQTWLRKYAASGVWLHMDAPRETEYICDFFDENLLRAGACANI